MELRVKAFAIEQNSVTPIFSKWHIVADKPILDGYGEWHPNIWQRTRNDGKIDVLCENDEELLEVKAKLDAQKISYTPKANIELSEEEKSIIQASNIRSRDQVQSTLDAYTNQKDAITNAGSLEELKDALLNQTNVVIGKIRFTNFT